MYQAYQAREEYNFASKLSNVILYERKHEEEFNSIGEEIKHLSYLGKNQYNFFKTFHIKDENNERELYKRVLELAGYSVDITLPKDTKLGEGIYYAHYLISIKW